jgi:hypothetical protein
MRSLRLAVLSVAVLVAWAVGEAVPVAAADFDTSLVSPMPRDWAVTAMTVGQFKADGHPDAAVAGNVASSIRVMLGNGDGTFRFGANYTVPGGPSDLTNADLRGIGKRDLVVSSGTSVSVLLGNGDGTFQAYQVVAGTLNNPRRVLTADLRGNGRTDILVVTFSGISVLLSNGDGTFQAPITTAVSAGYGVTVGDLRGNGHPDLVYGTTTGFEMRAGNGDGTFGAPTTYSVGALQISMVLAPLHGGGVLDLATVNQSPNRVTTFRGNGDGTFQTPGTTYPVESDGYLTTITAADLRGIGTLDLVATSTNAHVLIGRGDGTFMAVRTYPVRDRLNGLAVADLRGAGVQDIVVGRLFGRDIATLLGTGDGTFPTMRLIQAHTRPIAVAAGDFGTSHLSLAVQNRGSNDLSILLGNGDGTFQATVNYPLVYSDGAFGRLLAVGDFRNIGILDIAALRSGGVSFFRGNGDGTFSPQYGPPLGGTPTSIAMVDLRGLNRLDLLVTTVNRERLYVLLNNGDGTFAQPAEYTLPGQSYSVAAGDFRRNGIVDVAVGIATNRTVVVYRGNGDGTLGSTITYPAPAAPFAIVAAPLRQAGLVDLAYAAQPASDPNSATVELLLNDGSGSFTAGGSYAIGGYPADLAAVDLDGSGRLDIVSAGATTGAVSVLMNQGGGIFAPARHFGAGLQPWSLVVGDFREDGRLDIVTASDEEVDLLLGI